MTIHIDEERVLGWIERRLTELMGDVPRQAPLYDILSYVAKTLETGDYDVNVARAELAVLLDELAWEIREAGT